MKKLIFTVMLFSVLGISNSFGQTKIEVENTKTAAVQTANFGVRGNCGMCKTTIEKAASAVKGVSEAQWDKNRKSISVTFDSAKTNELKIHKAIAKSGYDTEKVKGDLKAYSKLPGCCKYDHSMEMNQKVKSK